MSDALERIGGSGGPESGPEGGRVPEAGSSGKGKTRAESAPLESLPAADRFGQAILGLLIAALLASWLPWPAAADPCFTEQAQFGSRATIAIAWTDADRDGDLDLAVGNYGQANQLFLNNGNGTFSEQAQFGSGATFAVVWGDFDNDGDADMAVGRGNGQQNYLYVNNGNGTFTQQSQFGLNRTIALAWGDYDRDGDLDMAVGNGILGVAEQNWLYVNNGDGTFTQQAQFGTGQTCTLVWGDCDNDGDLDLAVGNGGFGYEGQNYLYVNNGNGTFTERAEFGLGDTSCMAWGDCDNDGDLDLAVGNWNNGQSSLYRNDGTGHFTEEPVFGIHVPNGIAWGDYNNDGWLDLAMANGTFTTADQNLLFVNNGDGSFTEVPQFGLGSTDSAAWADTDADGDLDLAVGNEHTPTQNYLYVNCGAAASWLEILPVGHFFDRGTGYSNRDGVGARIAVYEAGFLGDPAHLLGMREIEAHGGFSSQNDRAAHFGVPGRSTVDLRISWPGSGGTHQTQDLSAVATGARLTVEEPLIPAGIPAPGPSGPDRSSILRISPNPTQGGAVLEWRSSSTEGGRLQIFAPSGRLVRVLRGDRGEGGKGFRATWDGAAENGRRAPAGIYLVRGEGAGESCEGRLLVVR